MSSQPPISQPPTLQPLIDSINDDMEQARQFPNSPWTVPVLSRKVRTMSEVREFGSKGVVPYPKGHDDKPYSEEWLNDIAEGLEIFLAEQRGRAARESRLAELTHRALSVMTREELDTLMFSCTPTAGG